MNYAAYAATLNDSLRSVGHAEPHYVLIVDYQKEYQHLIKDFKFTPVYLENLHIPEIDELIKRYNAFELSNVLKPYFIEWLLKKHGEISFLVYLDTDIYVYSKLDNIFDYLKSYTDISVAISPHIIYPKNFDPQNTYDEERMYLKFGLYNGGFYAVKNNSESLEFLNWQKQKLRFYGYFAPSAQMFVDQKILDFTPIIFNYVGIFRNPTYNISHWNYDVNRLTVSNNRYFIDNKPLTFFHFSQINKFHGSKNFNFGPLIVANNSILEKLITDYLLAIDHNNHQKISKIPYKYIRIYQKPDLSLIDPLAYKTELLTKMEKQHTLLKCDLIKQQDFNKKQHLEFEQQINHTQQVLDTTSQQLHLSVDKLHEIYNSQGWRLLRHLYIVRDFIFPKRVKTLIKQAIENLKPKSKPIVTKRKINLQSKKIVYIGHSYHAKTKSTTFLLDYLKKHFDVTELTEDSWKGEKYPDLSFVNHDYLGVIFFQDLPPKEIYDQINNDNLIFFPMYDSHGGLPKEYWDQYRNLKIISFSQTLYRKLINWGFDCLYVQYFPKPLKFTRTKGLKIFFWQRVNKIDINLVEKLLGKARASIHIHQAIDPNNTFTQPTPEQEKKFKITYSSWFETRQEMQQKIQECNIYIAPREYEGIGLSFLEAMAMGKAVIAVNNPTMNEYIVNKKNGYLYDTDNIKILDFNEIKTIQNNSRKSIKHGYIKWSNDRKKIVSFIKK